MRFVLGLIALACSEPAPARVVPEPLAVDEPATVEREAPENAPPEDGSIEVLVMPEGWRATEHLVRTRPYEDELTEDAPSTLVEVLHPRARVRARLEGMVRGWLLSMGTPAEPFASARCEAGLASEPLVSLRCNYMIQEQRGGGTTFVASANFRIEGDDVVPFELGDEIFDRAERQRLAGDHCVAHTPVPDYARDDVAGWREQLRTEDCAEEWVESIEPRGIFLESWYQDRHVFHLAFSAIAQKIRGDGPLGVLATLGAGVTTERVVPPAAAERERPIERTAVSPIAHIEELMRAWMALAPVDRARIELAQLGWGASRLVLEADDDALAARIASQLGAAPERVSLASAPLELAFVRAAREEVHLRTTPNGSSDWGIVRLLPAGTRFAAVLGTFENYESVIGQRRHYTRVVSNETDSGWIASRYVELEEGCVPDPSAFLARLPERERERIQHHVASGVVPVRRAGQSREALFFAASGQRESFVSLFERGEDGCTPGALIREVRVPGSWVRVGLPGTTERGGDTLVVVIARTESALETSIFSLHATREPLRTIDHAANFGWDRAAFARAGGRYCPLAIGDACFVWQDGALVEAE